MRRHDGDLEFVGKYGRYLRPLRPPRDPAECGVRYLRPPPKKCETSANCTVRQCTVRNPLLLLRYEPKPDTSGAPLRQDCSALVVGGGAGFQRQYNSTV